MDSIAESLVEKRFKKLNFTPSKLPPGCHEVVISQFPKLNLTQLGSTQKELMEFHLQLKSEQHLLEQIRYHLGIFTPKVCSSRLVIGNAFLVEKEKVITSFHILNYCLITETRLYYTLYSKENNTIVYTA